MSFRWEDKFGRELPPLRVLRERTPEPARVDPLEDVEPHEAFLSPEIRRVFEADERRRRGLGSGEEEPATAKAIVAAYRKAQK